MAYSSQRKGRLCGPPLTVRICRDYSALIVGVDDALDGAVGYELGEGVVDGGVERVVALGEADSVLLLNPGGLEDLQAGVGGDEFLRGAVVDDNRVDLAVLQGLGRR